MQDQYVISQTINNNRNMSNGSGEAFVQQRDDNNEHSECSGQDGSKTSLIVNYLPQTMTQEEIRSLFAVVGELESCKLIRGKVNVTNGDLHSPLITGHSLGYAFVNFIRPEDAEKAISSLNGLRLQNKTIKVSYARPSSDSIKGANLYVSGLSKNLNQDDLEGLFRPFGHIITSRILYDSITVGGGENLPGISRGVGFIRFDQRQEAERAIQELNGTIPNGSTERLTVKFANNPGGGGGGGGGGGNSNKGMLPMMGTHAGVYQRNFVGPTGPIHNIRSTGRFRYSPLSAGGGGGGGGGGDLAQSNDGTGWCIFIYNLAPETEDSTLWQLFGPFGAVLSVKVIRDMLTNECKGFGFVTMSNYDDAAVAIQALNGYMVGNRILQVSFKVNKSVQQGKARIRM